MATQKCMAWGYEGAESLVHSETIACLGASSATAGLDALPWSTVYGIT